MSLQANIAAPSGHPLRAAVWMIGTIISFTLMAIAGRAVSLELDTFEIMLYRSLIGIVIVVTLSRVFGTWHQVTSRSLHIHGFRNLCHFTGQNLWFFALTAAPLAQVVAFEFTAPLWVTLLAPLILAERITRMRLLAALLGFVGILIVLRPDADTLNWGVLAAATAAVGFAGSAVFTRLLTRSETITCIMFWLTVMQAVFGLLTAGIDGEVTLPSVANWPWLVLIGCAGLMAHFCLTNALSLAPVTVVMPMDFARLPIVALVGVLLYSEPLEVAVFLGAGVIFFANYINIRAESRRPR